MAVISLSSKNDEFNQKRSKNRKTIRALYEWLTLAITILVITWFCRFLLESVFNVALNNTYWHRDYLGNLSLAIVAFLLIQKLGKSLILASLVIIGFQLVNGGKLVVLGTPISPDDFINVHNLFYLTDGWRRLALISIIALPVVLTVLFVPWYKAFVWIIMLFGLAGTLLAQHSSEPIRVYLDSRFGHSVWNQPDNFARRGLGLHIVQESVRTMAKVGSYPDKATVDQALRELATQQAAYDGSTSMPRHRADQSIQDRSSNTATPQRNVHIIVLESFFDPLTLGPDWVPEDPLPDSFRALWEKTGFSKALSPVFGGYTANAEFETLCGFPVTENAVFFEGWLRRSVPCLPRILADAGYKSVASHPNVSGFWNRTHAYNLMGFDTYLSKNDFDLSDSVDGLLLDHSYYDQVFNHSQLTSHNGPLFNYMLTYHGHLPYPSNEHYPDQVKAGRESVLLNAYLNQIWYKSRDLMNRLEQLREDDPTALIVAFGDHLPFLGPNYGVYSDVLGLPQDRAQFTGDMLEYLVSTPLIIIDGENGPLDVGKLPLYQLPSLLLDLLKKESGSKMFQWSQNPASTLIRPIYGMHIDVFGNKAIVCPDDETAPVDCTDSADWLARTRLLISDIFTGNQLSLKILQTPNDS